MLQDKESLLVTLKTRMRYSYACVVQLYTRAQIGSFLSLITWSRGSGGGDEWRLWWRCWLCVCPPWPELSVRPRTLDRACLAGRMYEASLRSSIMECVSNP